MGRINLSELLREKQSNTPLFFFNRSFFPFCTFAEMLAWTCFRRVFSAVWRFWLLDPTLLGSNINEPAILSPYNGFKSYRDLFQFRLKSQLNSKDSSVSYFAVTQIVAPDKRFLLVNWGWNPPLTRKNGH
jgi:hypothetical protein